MSEDVRGIPIVSFEFFKHLLPDPPVETSAIKRQLEGKGDLSHKGWKHWPKTPSKTQGDESEVFEAFVVLVGDIIAATELESRIKSTISHLNNLNFTSLYNRDISSKSDGYQIFLPMTEGSCDPDESLRPYPKLLHELRQKLVETGASNNSISSSDIFWEDINVPYEYRLSNDKEDRADVGMPLLR
jgi:hypothetical protein